MEWFVCFDTSPSEGETVLLTFKNSAGLHVGEATFQNGGFYYVAETNEGTYEEQYSIPVAWTKMPMPYTPTLLNK